MFIYARLTNALIEGQTALSEGDFVAARVALTEARAMNAKINRMQVRLAKASDDEWAKQQNASGSAAIKALALTKTIRQSWREIAQWLDIVINKVGREELVKSREGVDILLDRFLPFHWDVNHDIVVLSGPNSGLFIDALVDRGQTQFIIVRQLSAAEEIDAGKTYQSFVEKLEGTAYLLEVDDGGLLNDEQLDSLIRAEPPGFVSIPTDSHGVELESFASLEKQIKSKFIQQATQRLLSARQCEHFLQNLPNIYCSKTTSDIKPSLAGVDVMIASPGPSLSSSIDDIKTFRNSFVLIAPLRSLPVLLDNNVIPDFAILQDPADHTAKGLDLLPSDFSCEAIPLIISEYAHKTSFESRFKEFIVVPSKALLGSAISTAIHGKDALKASGTSVATFAVTICAELGARSITLVGQDLSVTDIAYAGDAQKPQTQFKGDSQVLSCQGIDGGTLHTQSNFLTFILEFEILGANYRDKLYLFNSTAKGAFLKNWNHLPLNAEHPVVLQASTRDTRVFEHQINKAQRPADKKALLRAISDEICEQTRIEAIATSLVYELHSLLLGDNGEDFKRLDSLEKDLSDAMNKQGSLIRLYTLPAKLETDASLASARNLEDNLMVSLDYYSAIRETARQAITLLRDSNTRIEQKMQITSSQK